MSDRYCVREVRESWTVPTTRGTERRTRWVYQYNDGTVETVTKRERV